MCIAVSLMIAAAMPAVSFAEVKKDNDFYSGYRQIDKKVHEVPSGPKLRTQDLPVPTESYYNSASQSWYRGVSRIKDQDKTGLCWAFASTSAAEISYAKEYYERTKRTENTLLSPAHMGYFLYNRVNDPLGNTESDFNKPEDDDWAMTGGQALLAMLHMSTWSGPGKESNTPFSSVVNNIKTDIDIVTGKEIYSMKEGFSFNESYAYNDHLTLENSIYYPEVDKQDTMKSLIYKYGAVDAALDMDENYFPGGDAIEEEAYYNPDAIAEYGTNHAVTVVGWDDNYSKDNFSSYSYYYSYYSDEPVYMKPKNNGAWIVQNSYGTDFHDGGYFYVSYESCGLTDSPVVAYDMQPADTYDYNYQYDGSVNPADTTESGLPVIYSKSRAANVFTAQDDIVLRAVGITEYDEGTTDYTVSIYTGLTKPESDPMSGKCVSMTTCSTDTPGCKTIPLTEPVAIDEGEKYSVVIMFNTAGTAFGAEKLEKDDDLNRSWLKIYVDTEPGQSFYRAKETGKWVDMSTTYGACFRIKGFADDPEIYNVTFTDGMGNTLGTERVKELRAAEGAYTPYRDGYRFTGWDTDISSVTEEMTVNAQWAKLYSIDPIFTGYGTVAPAGGAVPGELVTVNMAGETGHWPDVNSIYVCNDDTGEFIPVKVSYSLTEDEQYDEILDRTNVKVKFIMPEGDVGIYASFVERPANTMTAKGKTVKVKYSTLKKKAVSVKGNKAITVTNAAGKASYKILSVKKAKFKKYFKISSKTGTITVKKGLKKGKYKLTIKVSDPGSALYYPKTKKVTVTVKVK